MNQDLNVQIRRIPNNQNYCVLLLKITNSQPAKCETYICQTLIEVMQKIADFESKYLHQFENAIDYKKIDWCKLVR